MKLLSFASLLVAFLCFAACSTEAKSTAQPAYTLVFLKTGPESGQLSADENKQAFAGHFANMGRLAEEHKLVLAGPFGNQRHDATLRGLFVINSAERAEASAWASTDPAAQAGVFILEYHDFATDAPLVAMLDRDLERERAAKAEGRTPDPGDGARPYVLLTAEDQDIAKRELTPLMKGGGLLLLAQLDGSRALGILDAQDVADAQAKYGTVLERIGAHTLDDWFATEQLAKLSEH